MDRERSTIDNLVFMSIVAYIAQLHVYASATTVPSPFVSLHPPVYSPRQLTGLIDCESSATDQLIATRSWKVNCMEEGKDEVKKEM